MMPNNLMMPACDWKNMIEEGSELEYLDQMDHTGEPLSQGESHHQFVYVPVMLQHQAMVSGRPLLWETNGNLPHPP